MSGLANEQTVGQLLIDSITPEHYVGHGTWHATFEFDASAPPALKSFLLRVPLTQLNKIDEVFEASSSLENRLLSTSSLNPPRKRFAGRNISQPLLQLPARTMRNPTGYALQIIEKQPGQSLGEIIRTYNEEEGLHPDHAEGTVQLMEEMIVNGRGPLIALFEDWCHLVRSGYRPDGTSGNILLDRSNSQYHVVDSCDKKDIRRSTHVLSVDQLVWKRCERLLNRFLKTLNDEAVQHHDVDGIRDAFTDLIHDAYHEALIRAKEAPIRFETVTETKSVRLHRPSRTLAESLKRQSETRHHSVDGVMAGASF